MAPQDVTWDNEEAVWKRLYGPRLKGQKKPQFKVGDRVRLNKIHRTFEKGYLPGWTEEVFVVHRVIPGPVPTYKIHEWDDTPVQGTFYEEDLQKVHVSEVFRIEKVLKRQKDRWLVKWKGWPDKCSWRRDVSPTKQEEKDKAAPRDKPAQKTTTTRLNNDVGAQLVVLRDDDESCEYQRVSWEQESSFQKPIA